MGARADAEEVHVLDFFNQGIFFQRGLQVLNVGVACCLQGVERILVHAFQQQKADFVFVQRQLLSHLDLSTMPKKFKPHMLPYLTFFCRLLKLP